MESPVLGANMKQPLVSVVVPSYNHGRFVEQALDSVAAQTWPHIELVVLDDASTDDAPERIRAWAERADCSPIIELSSENRGVCAAFNHARTLISGDYVAFMAADDWMEPERIDRQVRRMQEAGERCGLVYSDVHRVDEEGASLGEPAGGPHPEGDVYIALLRENFIPAPAVLMRRAALEAAGPYDTRLRAEDYDMWLRIAFRWEIAYEPGALVNYRILSSSVFNSAGVRRSADRFTILTKHVGHSAEGDRAIADNLDRHARALFDGGYDPRVTRAALRLSVRLHPRPRTVAYLAIATVGLSGPRLRRARWRTDHPESA